MALRSKTSGKSAKRGVKQHSTLKNYLVPHEGNDYHPKLFRTAAVAILVLGIVIFEGAYIVDTKLAQNHTNFLASVLPAALLDLTNADRASNGVAPLTHDPLLDQAAQLKANDMAQNGYFAHVSPTGKTPWYWLGQVGYSYTYAGENLAINFDDSTAVESAWMNSPTHRANIVKPQYTRVGYAVAQGMYEGKETTFVVQEFAATPNDETVTQEVKPENPVQKVVAAITATVVSSQKPETATDSSKVNIAGPAASTSPEVKASESAPTYNSSQNAVATGVPTVLATQTGGTQQGPSSIGDFFKRVAASPTHTSTYVLGTLATLIALLLVLALVLHAQVKYLEVLSGGLIVILFALGLLVYNATHSPTPTVPDGTDASLHIGANE